MDILREVRVVRDMDWKEENWVSDKNEHCSPILKKLK